MRNIKKPGGTPVTIRSVSLILILFCGCGDLLGIGSVRPVEDAPTVIDGDRVDAAHQPDASTKPDGAVPPDALVCQPAGEYPNDPTGAPGFTCDQCEENPAAGRPGCSTCTIGYQMGPSHVTQTYDSGCCAFHCCWTYTPHPYAECQ